MNFKFIIIICSIISIIILSVLFIYNTNFYYSGPETNHFKNGKFFNPYNTYTKKKNFFQVMIWFIKRSHTSWKEIENQKFDVPPNRVFSSKLRVSNIGHNSFLIQTEGINILTDPVWSERASPFSFIGPKRFIQAGIKFENLPPIDVIWVSHNHYDHMDLKSLYRLWKKFHPRIITPLGNDYIIKSYNKNIKCETYDWYDTVKINKNLNFYLRPMQHWSSRGLFDHNKALWAALEIKTNSPKGNILFIGDSGYNKQLFSNYDKLRLAIIPMGAYRPRWLLEYSHMSPENLFQAHKNLSMPLTIPSHYDVFDLADEEQFEAIRDLREILHNNPDNNIHLLEVGNFIFLN